MNERDFQVTDNLHHNRLLLLEYKRNINLKVTK